MKRQTVILIAALVFVGSVSTAAFAQKGGRSGRSSGSRKSVQQKSFKGNQGGWNKGHSFHSNKGHSNKGWNHGNGSGRSNGVNYQKWSQHKQAKQNNFKWNGGSFHKSQSGKKQTHGHSGQGHKVKKVKHHGHFNHGHFNKGHFYGKYYRAQHHFAVRSNLHFVNFYQFPYDVCWHNGKYWVCFDGVWMPYSYLIQNHAGAWNWHQAYYKRHNHVAYKNGWKTGKKVRLSFKK